MIFSHFTACFSNHQLPGHLTIEDKFGRGEAYGAGAGAIEKETRGCGAVIGFHREGVGGNETGDSWERSEAGDQPGSIGILLRGLKGVGTDGEAII
jgi:hypothetical protein